MGTDDKKGKTVLLPRPGEIINDLYRLKDIHASGGMGIIMKAEQIRIGRDVAVKLLHPHVASSQQLAARFLREVQVTTLFDHANIVRVYDVGETEDGALYLVMEMLEGEELEDIIAREAPLSVGRTIDISLQILDGLGEAHSRGVVHRDLKPSNVFVTKTRHGTDEIKLLDFGIAKLIQSDETKLTATGRLTGTPAYVAPETMLGLEETNKKAADIYAVGLVIVEMLIGREVFKGATVAQTLLQHLKKPIVIPESIDETPLGEVIRRATSKHPEDRYQDGDEMYRALVKARDDSPLELTLEATDIPEPVTDTNPGLLEKLEAAGEGVSLELLRDVPQHESFVAGQTPSPSTTSSPADPIHAKQRTSTGPNLSGLSSRVIVDAPLLEEKRKEEKQKERTGTAGVLAKVRGALGSSIEIMLVLAVLIGTWVMLDPFNRDAPEPGEAVKTGNPTTIRIDSEPTGAEFWFDGEKLGETALRWEFDGYQFPLEVVFRKEGYEDKELAIDEDHEPEIAVHLQEIDGD